MTYDRHANTSVHSRRLSIATLMGALKEASAV